MNIRCPQCQTNFRVNPDRIPPRGARARCARCGATFQVQPPVPAAPAAAVGAAPPRPAPLAQSAVSSAPGHAPAPGSHPGTRSAPAAGSPFAARDPNRRAERLARALVSDIVAYHPDRRDRSLATGSLRTEFREEIMKSWEEYVAQVGLALAKSTPYFRNALNEILAKGELVF